jgi:ADP-heptose:LPS heptosyltransferase
MARDLSPCLSSFADTAAVVGRLDLVITVDTSVAHLAGAMGRPVWVMLAQRCDWRWSASNARCYPSARLFRRCDGDDWTDLAQTVAMSLREWRALPAR